jgi:hypothetical protein
VPVSGGSIAAEATELLTAFKSMYELKLDTASTVAFETAFELSHKDLNVSFESGRIAFFEPVIIDSRETIYGGYFEGEGRLRFAPPVDMEREQLQRFYKSDSLDRTFDKMILLFSGDIYDSIAAATVPAGSVFNGSQVKSARQCCEEMKKDDYHGYIFEAFSGLVHLSQRPFLMLNTEPDNSSRIFYIFNPNRREEVRFLKRYAQVGFSFMETVCRYSQYIDPGYTNLNGLPKTRIAVDRFTIDSEIGRDAEYNGSAKMTFEVILAPTRALAMSLHHKLVVDSIRDSTGQQVSFYRYDVGEMESRGLYLFFDRPLSAGEIVTLEFFYGGEIIHYSMGQCFMLSGADWYPRYGYAQRALFTLNFMTHKRWKFVATGNLVSEEAVGDMVSTTWKVAPPASNVSFNVGMLTKYTFEEEAVVPIDVYFSEELHSLMADQLAREYVPTGKDMQDQVAEDVLNSMKVFNEVFGDYQYRRMVVGEILQMHAEAFPGFLHLGFDTWISTDSWGYERAHRAHEVAHQWWGVGVGYQTYHDQWLSEGLAEYSALMYLQAAEGNDRFLERLRDYRNDIFTARQYLFGSGAEAGPIVLGYRTSSSETRGDYGLIVYKKAALVLHMLRNLLVDLKTMQEDRFRTMMKDYYNTHRGDRITTQDFRRLVEKHVGVDMGWFFNQWVYRSDLPTYEFTWDYEPSGRNMYTVHCKVVTTGVPDDFQMYVPLEIEIDKDNKAYIRIFIDSPVYEFSLPDLPRIPRNLRLNPFESVLAKVKQ